MGLGGFGFTGTFLEGWGRGSWGPPKCVGMESWAFGVFRALFTKKSRREHVSQVMGGGVGGGWARGRGRD